MKLYHISRELQFNSYFEPRIPSLTDDSTENRTIPRICFSKSLEGCLSAIPGADELDMLLLEQRSLFRVYELETDDYEISPEELILTDTIDQNGWVHDAHLNDECWVTKPLTFKREDSYIILVEHYDETEETCVSFHIREIADTSIYDGDVTAAFFDSYPDRDRIPSVYTVNHLSYSSSKSDFPLQVEFLLQNEEFSETTKEEETLFTRTLASEHHLDYENLIKKNDTSGIRVTFPRPEDFNYFCQCYFDFIQQL